MPPEATTQTSTTGLTLVEGGLKGYIDSWDVNGRRISQDEANYNPFGATGGKGCANCRWFVSPDSCVIVAGDISPSGRSKRYEALPVYEAEPMEVVIVDKAVDVPEPVEDLPVSFIERAKSILSSLTTQNPEFPQTMTFVQQKDGRIRWTGFVTNNYEDREGDTLTIAAHKEYVEWANETKEYPELWHWHVPGTRWGMVDHLGLTDEGFVLATGLVDKGHEDEALAVSRQRNLGMSHTYQGLKTLDKRIIKYRMIEVSDLPLQNAANFGTAFSVEEMDTMGLAAQTKDYLRKAGYSDERIGALEATSGKMAETFKSLGLSAKGLDDDGAVQTPPGVGEQFAANAIGTLAEGMTQLAGKIDELVQSHKAISAKQATHDAALVEAKKSLDEAVAGVLTPKVIPLATTPPSADPSTIVETKSKEAAGPYRNSKEFDDFLRSSLGSLIPNGQQTAPVADGAAAE